MFKILFDLVNPFKIKTVKNESDQSNNSTNQDHHGKSMFQSVCNFLNDGPIDWVCRDDDIIKNLINNLYELQKSGLFCDYELKTEDGCSFLVHKWVLRSNSSFFNKLFDTVLSERNTNTYLVRPVTSDCLSKIIKYMYTGDIEINYDNCKEILDISLYLNLYKLVIYCIKILIKNVNINNWLELLKYSEKCLHYGEELALKCLSILIADDKERFYKFLDTIDYYELSIDTIKILINFKKSKSIVADDQLTDEDIYLAFKKWIMYDTDERAKYIEQLIEEIKLENLSLEFVKMHLFGNSNGDNNISNDKSNRNVNNDDDRSNDDPILKNSRFHKKMDNLLRNNWNRLKHFNSDLYGIFDDELYAYDNNNKKFSNILTYIRSSHNSFSYTTFGNEKNIFFCGGKYGSDIKTTNCTYYSIDNNKWHKLPSMINDGRLLCEKLININGKIYVYGYKDCKSSYEKKQFFDAFDVSSLTWCEVVSTKTSSSPSSLNMCSLNDCIYFVDGNVIDYYDNRQSSITRFCTHTRKNIYSVESYDNFIYGFNSSNISVFDIRSKKWLEEKQKSYDAQIKDAYTDLKTSSFNNQIYMFTKCNDGNYLQTFNATDLSSIECNSVSLDDKNARLKALIMC